MVEYRDPLVVILHSEIVSEIASPDNVKTSYLLGTTGIEQLFQFHMFLFQQTRSAKICRQRRMKSAVSPNQAFSTVEDLPEISNKNHQAEASSQINRVGGKLVT